MIFPILLAIFAFPSVQQILAIGVFPFVVATVIRSDIQIYSK